MSDDSNDRERLSNLLTRIFDTVREELDDSSSPETVAGWDSVSHLNLVMALESEFGITLTPEDALEMKNLGLIRTILREHGVDA
ncbi:MAG: acyl carrier protein [bacterium]|nr:acyl carrier protein [bacterium]